MKNKIEELIIIGSGPAGLTAAIYAARAHLSPKVFLGTTPGGQLMKTSFVENWPGEKRIMGPDLMMNMQDQAKEQGAELIEQTVTGVNFQKSPFSIKTETQEYLTKSVIIATGATPNKLGCLGEEEYWGKGITSCGVCDAPFYKDKKVIVIGGGDTAMEDASFLRKYTDQITVVQVKDKLTASQAMQKKVINDPVIKIIYNSTVTKFEGDGQNLQKAIITNQKTNETSSINIDGAFIAIGLTPNTALFKGQIELSNWGYIQVQNNVFTSVKGVFTAGDVHDFKYKQAVVAAGSGCMAALEVERYLNSI